MGEERRMTVPDVGGVVGRTLSPAVLPDEDVVRRVLAGETALFKVLILVSPLWSWSWHAFARFVAKKRATTARKRACPGSFKASIRRKT